MNEQRYKLNVKPPNVISLIILSAFATMGAILITPALPFISQYFNISVGHSQLTVTSFLLGYALGQLLYGPISNQLGRKPAFYIGIGIATLGSIFSILSSPAHSFTLMIVGRLFEALGSSVGLVVCLTIINDFYFPAEARKMVGFMSLAFAIVPGIAIAVGGMITQYLNWEVCFYFLLCYGLVLIIPAMILPETITQYDPNALKGRYLIKNYRKMFLNRKLVAYSCIYGLTAAAVYIFSAEGPIIGIKYLHYEPGTYGLLGLIPYPGAILGSFITIRYSTKFSSRELVKFAIILEAIGMSIMFISFLVGFVNIVTLIGPMIILMVGHALLCSNAPVLAIAESEDKANASAVINFIAVSGGVIGTFVLSMIHSSNLMVLPTMFLVIVLMLSLIYFFEE